MPPAAPGESRLTGCQLLTCSSLISDPKKVTLHCWALGYIRSQITSYLFQEQSKLRAFLLSEASSEGGDSGPGTCLPPLSWPCLALEGVIRQMVTLFWPFTCCPL